MYTFGQTAEALVPPWYPGIHVPSGSPVVSLGPTTGFPHNEGPFGISPSGPF
jgi:hypothetical protein